MSGVSPDTPLLSHSMNVTTTSKGQRMSSFLDLLKSRDLVLDEPSARSALAAISLLASCSEKSTYVWRGQDNASWDPVPSAYRRAQNSAKVCDAGPTVLFRLENQLVRSANDSKVLYQSGVEALAELQHNGAATRLLDVTMDPMASLWFAVNNEKAWDQPGIVYAFDTNRMDQLGKDVHASDGVLPTWGSGSLATPEQHPERAILVEVSRDSARIQAQRGSFIVLPLRSGDWTDLRPLLHGSEAWPTAPEAIDTTRELSTGPGVVAIIINPKDKRAIKELLRRAFGYSSQSIYPDLAGFCAANGASSEYEDEDVPVAEISEEPRWATNEKAVLLRSGIPNAKIVTSETGYAAWDMHAPEAPSVSIPGHEQPTGPFALYIDDDHLIISAAEVVSHTFDKERGEVRLETEPSEALTSRFKGFQVPHSFKAPALIYSRRFVPSVPITW